MKGLPSAAGKVNSFRELKTLGRELAAVRQRAVQEARQAQTQRAAAREQQSDADLFARAAGPVRPLRAAHARVLHAPAPTPPLARQRQRDEQDALRQALSDAFDPVTLLHADEHLSFRRPGIGPDVAAKLRRGEWNIQREIDLHGLRVDQAREALSAFVQDARRAGLRCVRVVHGKGLGSPGRAPVLKGKVHGWLIQKKEVLAFVQAGPPQGGAGALLVLLAGAAQAKAAQGA
ncbi:MAG: Smr/MutS family protein [Burkholderiaceae bacterium]|nr:Smr/MutS family protein [Burkholderiaceae bacterium]